MDRIRELIVILAFLPLFAHAGSDNVSLQFKQVRISELLEGVIKGVLQRDYVMSPEVSSNAAALSLSIKAIPKSRVLDTLRSTVAASGVVIVDRDGVLHIEKAALQVQQSDTLKDLYPVSNTSTSLVDQRDQSLLPDQEIGFYLPRYRPAEFLALALRAAGVRYVDSKDKRDYLVYEASADRLEKLQALLREIDRPVSSVLVRAALLEVSKSSDQSRSLSAAFDLIGGKLGIRLQPSKSYGNSLSLAGVSLQAVLSAVDGDNRFRYLAEPQLKVVDGETARLVVGQDVPVRGNTVIANNQTTQGVEYRTVGVVIEIEPRILQDSMILRVKQTVSDVVQTTTSGIDSPTMQKREAHTTVLARDGELLVIAGMDSERISRTEAGISFLPAIFGSTSESKSNNQMLLLLEVTRL